jgi:hypothetical protein
MKDYVIKITEIDIRFKTALEFMLLLCWQYID